MWVFCLLFLNLERKWKSIQMLSVVSQTDCTLSSLHSSCKKNKRDTKTKYYLRYYFPPHRTAISLLCSTTVHNLQLLRFNLSNFPHGINKVSIYSIGGLMRHRLDLGRCRQPFGFTDLLISISRVQSLRLRLWNTKRIWKRKEGRAGEL